LTKWRCVEGKNGSTKTTFMAASLPTLGSGTMVVAAFVAPYLLEATARFVHVAATLPDVRLGLVTCEPLEAVPPDLRRHLAGHWRVDDALDPQQVATAVAGLRQQMGGIDRLVGALEQLQV